MKPTQPSPDRLVARHLGDVLAVEPIPGVAIERDRGFLYRRRAELSTSRAMPRLWHSASAGWIETQ